jgi:hypothetical protein
MAWRAAAVISGPAHTCKRKRPGHNHCHTRTHAGSITVAVAPVRRPLAFGAAAVIESSPSRFSRTRSWALRLGCASSRICRGVFPPARPADGVTIPCDGGCRCTAGELESDGRPTATGQSPTLLESIGRTPRCHTPFAAPRALQAPLRRIASNAGRRCSLPIARLLPPMAVATNAGDSSARAASTSRPTPWGPRIGIRRADQQCVPRARPCFSTALPRHERKPRQGGAFPCNAIEG